MNPKKKNSPSIKEIPEWRIKLYENDPYFRKKDEEAKRQIDKYGIPEELLKRKK
jgi:hypothetical protein